MSVKRYSVNLSVNRRVEVAESLHGSLVKYHDYAALEARCAALAAEVQAVRWAAGQVYSAGYNHGHLNTADELPYASDEELLQRGNEVLIEFTDPDHSGNVTDACLAEVRAQESKRVYETILDNPAVTDMESLVDWLEQNANDSVAFAAQLRKGVQS
ncbi:hypothetical protein [Enterobacter roggenkampii]|uniref:Uncharacterized protein n=1 Tax=Enterobacter roggenkampii TaxID=1812935 RepID=A0AAU9C721_9ENTR|nr:hypothetical protein [Enterobacter roggenkampii]BCL41748.1 hypothetical protein OIPHN260_12500 [Enterobacter roggenkampii]